MTTWQNTKQDTVKTMRDALGDFAVQVLRAPPSLIGRDVCLFAIYAPNGVISTATARYLRVLRDNGFVTIACLAVNDLGFSVEERGLEAAEGVLIRRNGGMDFGMWAAALRHCEDAWNAERLIFANDSVLVLPALFKGLATDLRNAKTPFVALTESREIRPHVQSYFFMLQADALSSSGMRRFWCEEIQVLEDKHDIIKTYEITLLERFIEDFGLSATILFSFERHFPGADMDILDKQNVSLLYWEYLVSCGMPFIKAEVLRDNPLGQGIAHWRSIVQRYGASVNEIADHIAVARPKPFTKAAKKRHKKLFGLGRFLRLKGR